MSAFAPEIKSELSPELVSAALDSQKMKTWIENCNDSDFNVNSVEIQSVDMFGKNVGFVKFKAEVTCRGNPVPGIVFMRGASVAVLIILSCNGERYILCTKQARFPICDSRYIEIPAGMMDEEGNFIGVAAKEVKEETGIAIDITKLIALGSMYPSPGGSDEMIQLFAYEMMIDQALFDKLQNAKTGNVKENEIITLDLIPYHEVHLLTDSKALVATFRYERLFAENV
jgi:ADP-sugar diphosphatase